MKNSEKTVTEVTERQMKQQKSSAGLENGELIAILGPHVGESGEGEDIPQCTHHAHETHVDNHGPLPIRRNKGWIPIYQVRTWVGVDITSQGVFLHLKYV